MRGKYLFFLFFFLFVCGYSKPWAQETKKELYDLSLEDLMNIEITTVTQRSQKITDAPATVISFTDDQIEGFGWRDLKDLFRHVTGVDVSYDVQGEIKSLITIRGIEGNQKILVLQDGQRQNPITGERFVFGHNIPLHVYKRVEIVFGPASALYGADAYAGVVNLITKNGADVDGMTASVGYASTNAMVGNLVFGKALNETTDVLISGRIYTGQDFKYHRHYKDPIDYADVERYEGRLGTLAKEYPIKNWNLLCKVKHGKLTMGFDWQHELESNAPSSIPTNYAYVKNNVWGQDIRHLYFTYEIYKTNRFNVSANLSMGDYAINPISNFFIPVDNDGNGLPDDASAGYKYGYSGYVEGSFKALWVLSEKLNVVGGISYSNVLSFPKTKNLDEPYHLDEGYTDNLSFFVDPSGYTFGMLGFRDSVFTEKHYYNLATYAQAEYKPSDKWIITFGGRYDYNSMYKSAVNPRLGIVFKASSRLTLKALYGTAFIAPSNYYRYENWANPYAMHIPNVDIKPERIETFEVSGIYYPSQNLSFRMSVYRNNMKEIIRPVEAPEQAGNYPYYNPVRASIGENPESGFVEVNANLGKIYSYGVELDVKYQLNRFILSVGYGGVNGTDEAMNSNLPKVSQHKLNAGIRYNAKKLYGSVTARYYGDVWTAPGNSYYQGTSEIPGALVVYTNFGYRFSNRFSANLSVDNLFNRKHWGAAPYGESIWIQPRAPQAMQKLFFGVTLKM